MAGVFDDLKKKGIFDGLTKEITGEGVFDDLTTKTALPETPSFTGTGFTGEWEESPSLIERGFKQFVNKFFTEPARTLLSEGGIGDIDTALRIAESGELPDPSEGPRKFSLRDLGAVIRESNILATKYKEETRKAVGEIVPGFDVPEAKTAQEKVVDITTSVAAFITRLALTRKILGVKRGDFAGSIVAWETENIITGGAPGAGAAMRIALGGIDSIPAATMIGKTAKLGAESSLFGGVTAAAGGNWEDVVTSALLPLGFRAWNVASLGVAKGRAKRAIKNLRAGGKKYGINLDNVPDKALDTIINAGKQAQFWNKQFAKGNVTKQVYEQRLTEIGDGIKPIFEAIIRQQPIKPAKPQQPVSKPAQKLPGKELYYHGSPTSGLTEIKPSRGDYGFGVYFADKDIAQKHYAPGRKAIRAFVLGDTKQDPPKGFIYSVKPQLNNPLIIENQKQYEALLDAHNDSDKGIGIFAREANYDGIINKVTGEHIVFTDKPLPLAQPTPAEPSPEIKSEIAMIFKAVDKAVGRKDVATLYEILSYLNTRPDLSHATVMQLGKPVTLFVRVDHIRSVLEQSFPHKVLMKHLRAKRDPDLQIPPFEIKREPKPALAKPSDNPYLKMPLDQIKEDATNGVKLAKDALIELQEITVTPVSAGQRSKIIETAVIRGLEQEHLIALSKYVTGIEDLNALTNDDAVDLLNALDNYRYMDTWKTMSVVKEPKKLVDPAMTKTQMNKIRQVAGSNEAYNKAMVYSQKLGGAPKNKNVTDITGRKALWHRDIVNQSRYLKRETSRQEKKKGQASVINPYQSMFYMLDKIERRTGVLLRRLHGDSVAESKGWNYKNEERMWQAITNAKVSRLGIVTNATESTKIARWLNEEDDAIRSNMWSDMKPKTQLLASEHEKILQEYAPFFVRWGRFLVWDQHAKIGERMLEKIRQEGKTPTDKQLARAQKKMREKKPPDAPMSVLAEGRAAREMGQLFEWLDAQEWGVRKRYYMTDSDVAGMLTEAPEGSISEEIFAKEIEMGELSTQPPSELLPRRGKGGEIISNNVSLDILRHLDRLSAFASTYETRMQSWEAFLSTNPTRDDLGLMRDADRALRGIMPKTLPIFKLARDFNRLFWRSYLVFDPRGSLWFAWRQTLQNLAFDPSQFNTVEMVKSIRKLGSMKTAREWGRDNPDAVESFIEYYNKNIAENRSFYRHFIMKSEEAGGLEMTSKLGTLVDMLAFVPGLTDKANRHAVWPIAYDIAKRNVSLFRDGKLSAQGLWNRLALNNVTSGESMEMLSLLENEDYPKFINRYAEYKVEKVHFRYNPLLRSIQEISPTGRITLGLITFPRGVMNIAIKGGVEPIADYAHNPSAKNARRAYDGFKTLIKLFAGTSLANMISIAVTGIASYGLWKLMFGPSILAPGFARMYEIMQENAFILHKAEQDELSVPETAAQMVASAANNIEMFIPFAEVMLDTYKIQNNQDGVHLYALVHKLAMKKFFNEYRKPFTYRNRKLHEKIRLMIIGKEPLKRRPLRKDEDWKKLFKFERDEQW